MLHPLVTHAALPSSPADAFRDRINRELQAAGWCRMGADTGDIEPGWANAGRPELTCWVRYSPDWARRIERIAYDAADDRLMVKMRGRSLAAYPGNASAASGVDVDEWLETHGIVIGGASDGA